MSNRNDITTKHAEASASVLSIGNRTAVILTGGREAVCLLPAGPSGLLAPGDRVTVSTAGNGSFRLEEILPRETALYRPSRRAPGEQVLLAANARLMLAVVEGRLLLRQAGFPEAAFLAARRAGMKAALFVSKWDLLRPSAQEVLREKLALYERSFDFLRYGASREEQPELLQAGAGQTVVLVGGRGCGKTTLLQSLLGGPRPPSPPPSTHTARMHPGPQGSMWIDTPGFREFPLPQASEEELAAAFPEIAPLAGACRFSNCTHTHEEGCALLDALRDGTLLRERYDAFQRLRGSLSQPPAAGKKPDYRTAPCTESFSCKACGALVTPQGGGTQHRNHCPHCLSSLHVDREPGDRAALCGGVMEPVAVWVRRGGEWAVIHRCRICGALSSNRVAADDNPALLLSIAVKPLASPPFPLDRLPVMQGAQGQ